MSSSVTSATVPLEMMGLKYDNGSDKKTIRTINIKVKKGYKDEGTAPAAHTMVPGTSEFPAVNTCYKCEPKSTC